MPASRAIIAGENFPKTNSDENLQFEGFFSFSLLFFDSFYGICFSFQYYYSSIVMFFRQPPSKQFTVKGLKSILWEPIFFTFIIGANLNNPTKFLLFFFFFLSESPQHFLMIQKFSLFPNSLLKNYLILRNSRK